MSYQDPYAHQRPNQQAYDPYYSAPNQYNNTYPPSDNSNVPWNEPPRASTGSKQYDSNYGPERLSHMGVTEPPKDTGELRLWRHSEHGSLLTKGGRGPCIGRFACCSIMTILFLLISIALSFAMWLRPPDITFGSIQAPTSGSAIQATTSQITINLRIPIDVKNPNFFNAPFEKISAKAWYPLTGVEVGGGETDNIAFAANSETSFNFPLSIVYSQEKDPNGAMLKDISDRCGFTGNPKREIDVKYTITLSIRLIAWTISPSFTGTTGFDCPLTKDQIAPFAGNLPGFFGAG